MSATRIDGPVPFRIRPIPGGVSLDMDTLARHVIGDVLEALLEADTGLWDLLHEVAALTPESAERERARGRLPYEDLVEALAGRASSRVAVYGRERLLEVAWLLTDAAARLPELKRRRSA